MQVLLPEQRVVEGPEALEDIYSLPEENHLRADFVISLDGAVDADGQSASLGGEADRAVFVAMRSVADVILVGAGTVRDEHYGPVKLGETAQARRVQRGQSPIPRLAIVSARGDLDPADKVFSGDSPTMMMTTSRVVGNRPDLMSVSEVVACGEAHVDLGVALGELRSRNLHRVLCEGGPYLLRSLLAEDLVDEMCLTIAPLLVGGAHRRLTGDGPLPDVARFSLEGLLEGDGMLIARYSRVR